MSEKCPVCENELNETKPWKHSGWRCYSCPMCGEFAMGDLTVKDLPTMPKPPDWRPILSHVIRKRHVPHRPPELRYEDIEWIFKNEQLPERKEQGDNLIRWLGDNLGALWETRNITEIPHRAIIGAKSMAGVGYVLDCLCKEGLLEVRSAIVREDLRRRGGPVGLSSAGWDRYEELQRTISHSRNAFMAMKFGHDKLDAFCHECVRPAIEQTGFHLVRVDWEPKEGPIDDRIMVEIRTARFLLADLTFNNQGVYWEAGFAKGLGKPVFYTCEKHFFKENSIHFDIRQNYVVLWEEGKFDEAAKRLKDAIRNTPSIDAKREDN